ncbi:MAG: PfkB family carbohydrate kinase [Motilibacteraceae bacterium]
MVAPTSRAAAARTAPAASEDAPVTTGARAEDLGRLLRSMAGLPVVVVGDAVLDVWVQGTATKLCREAPVPVVEEQEVRRAPGGAANIAANLAALGCQVTMVTALGGPDDDGADQLAAVLAEAGVLVRGPRVPRLQTPVKQRFVADGSIVARVDRGCRPREVAAVVAAELRQVLDELPDVTLAGTVDLREGAARRPAVVVGDYGLGAAGPEVVALLAEVLGGPARQRPCAVVVDAHDPARWREAGVHAMTPSWPELASLSGTAEVAGEGRRAWLSDNASEVLLRLGAERVAVTLDRHGAALLAGGSLAATVPVPDPVDVPAVGAGDSFTAAYAAALAVVLRDGRADDESLALALGCAAASLAVRRPGTAVCPREELLESLGLAPQGPDDGHDRDGDRDGRLDGMLAGIRRDASAAGRSVVLATGCFDQLHQGHVRYLSEAREQGDVLVVAVNSDRSMTALTQGRAPRQPLAIRLPAVERLALADHVVVFDEPSPRDVLRRLRPDVVVKGGDYVPEMVPELDAVREVGAELRLTSYLDLPMRDAASDASSEERPGEGA